MVDANQTAFGYLTDPDIDRAHFGKANHSLVAIMKVAGGWRLKCCRCKLHGVRCYQDVGVARRFAIELSSGMSAELVLCSPAAGSHKP